MNKIKRIAGVLALSMALAACHSVQETNPNQVAPTQQIKQLTGGGGGGYSTAVVVILVVGTSLAMQTCAQFADCYVTVSKVFIPPSNNSRMWCPIMRTAEYCGEEKKEKEFIDGYSLTQSLNENYYREKYDRNGKSENNNPKNVLIMDTNGLSTDYMYGFQNIPPLQSKCSDCEEIKLPPIPEYTVYSWQATNTSIQSQFNVEPIAASGSKIVADGLTSNGYRVVIVKVEEGGTSGILIKANTKQNTTATLNVSHYVQVQLPFFFSRFYNPNFFPGAIKENNLLLQQQNPAYTESDLIYDPVKYAGVPIDSLPITAYAPAYDDNYILATTDGVVSIVGKSNVNAMQIKKNDSVVEEVNPDDEFFTNVSNDTLEQFSLNTLKGTGQIPSGSYLKDVTNPSAFGSTISATSKKGTLLHFDTSLCSEDSDIKVNSSTNTFECEKYNSPPKTRPEWVVIGNKQYLPKLVSDWGGNTGSVELWYKANKPQAESSREFKEFTCNPTTIITANAQGKNNIICEAGSLPSGSYLNSCQTNIYNPISGLLTSECRKDDGTLRYSQLPTSECVESSISNKNGILSCMIIPDGSYVANCSNIQYNVSGILSASCKPQNTLTKLPYTTACKKYTTVSESNGNLVCDEFIVPTGPYLNTCTNLKYEKGVLSARCAQSNGVVVDTSLQYEPNCKPKSTVINSNGVLTCSQLMPPVPSGQYIGSGNCNNPKWDSNDLLSAICRICKVTNNINRCSYQTATLDYWNKCAANSEVSWDLSVQKLKCVTFSK